jgi:iron complex outermembrane receptor protein
VPFLLRAPRRALLLAATALAAPGVAFADAAPPLVDAVTVTANPNPEDPPVVAQVRRRLSETPGAVAAVSAESYESRYAQGLAEVVRDVPGVFAQKKWGDDTRLAIRGSGIGNPSHNRGTLLAQDGVPFNEADGFGDFQQIDPLIARYAEVYKGGNALRFGGALLGGAINLVTPTGATATAENRLRMDGGSYRTIRGHAELARQSGDWDVFAAATAISANGWRDQSDQTTQHLSLNLGRSFGEDREVRLVLSGHNVEQEIPGSVSLSQALTRPTAPNPANLANDYARNMRSVRATLQTRWRLSPGAVFDGGVYSTWKDLDHPIFQVIDQESRNWGAFGRLALDGELAGRRADAFVGASVRLGDLDAKQWVNLQSSRGAKTADSAQNARALDVFAEGRLFVTDALAVVAGGSLGSANRQFRNNLNRTADRSKTYEWFAPRVGLLRQAPDGAQVFANLTRSVEPPNFSALVQTGRFTGFAPLKPQDAWTAEVGTRGRRGPLTWDFALYRAELENELLNFIVSDTIPAATFNAGPTIHQGLEAGLDWRFAERFRLRQTYSWSDFRFDGDAVYGKNRLPVAPEHLYRAELRYDHPAGWFLAPSLEWSVADTYVDYANSLKAPGYAVWSLNAGWRGPNGVALFVEARNLADKRYVSNFGAVTDAHAPGVSTAVFFPGEGRSVFGGVSWDF